MKKYLPLFLCLFIVGLFLAGCATTQVVTKDEIWREPGLYAHIEKYVEEYGGPYIVMHGRNLVTEEEYVDLYWKIEEYWYKVQVYKQTDEWVVLQDQIATSLI